ncbi:MAG: hypothetical protein ACJ75T_02690 [Solirubrobacterales bacterium]
MTLALLLGAVLALGAGGSSAFAADLSSGLAAAEQQVAGAEEATAESEQQLEAAEARYRAAAKETAPLVENLSERRANARHLRESLATKEGDAGAHISQLEDQRQEEGEDHDQQVREGVGFGLAALIAGLIAVAWGWFRATAPVAALTRIELGQAIGVCVGGGLLLVVVGVVIGSSDGALGAVGSFLFWLGLILPTAFLLARHSAEVQRGRAKPLLRRERLPSWVSIGTACAMLLLFLAGTGSALFADDASSQPISAQLKEEAEATSAGRGAEELEATMAAVAEAERKASSPLARRSAAQEALADTRGELRNVRHARARAEASERSFTRRLLAAERKEALEAEQEAEELAREEAKLIERQEEEAAEQCNPNYSGCLDPYASDYDCAGGSGDGPEYTGTVEVTGYDEYELDDDGDGIGCDP